MRACFCLGWDGTIDLGQGRKGTACLFIVPRLLHRLRRRPPGLGHQSHLLQSRLFGGFLFSWNAASKSNDTRIHSDTHSLFSHTLVSLHLSLLHCWCKANILKFYQHMVRVFEPLPSHPYSPASISFLLRRDSPTNCWLPYLATRYQHRATSTWLHYDLHAPSSCTSDFLLFFSASLASTLYPLPGFPGTFGKRNENDEESRHLSAHCDVHFQMKQNIFLFAFKIPLLICRSVSHFANRRSTFFRFHMYAILNCVMIPLRFCISSWEALLSFDLTYI